MQRVHVREIWQQDNSTLSRYAGVALSADTGTAEISRSLAEELAAEVEGHDPELAARIREVCEGVRRTTRPKSDPGSEGDDLEDRLTHTALAYEILGLEPPAQGAPFRETPRRR